MSEHLFTSLAPFSGALTPVYIVPEGKRATVRIICTNRSAATIIRVTVSPSGEPDDISHSILHNSPIVENGAIATAPVMLNTGDVLRVLSYSGEVNFHVTGLLQDI